MPENEYSAFQKARQHATAARRETEAMLKCLLPASFWDHARTSREETVLALRALQRGVRKHIKKPGRRDAARQRIKIA